MQFDSKANERKKLSGEKTLDVIILAAGYATRLYPLRLTRPKPLLDVEGKPIIEYIIERLPREADQIYIVVNEKVYADFLRWFDSYVSDFKKKIKFVNDCSEDENDKLGAIGDLNFVLSRESVQGDILVVAGDNLFTDDLGDFYRTAIVKSEPFLAVYDVGDIEWVKRLSSVSVDDSGRVTFFEEKPLNPKSTLVSTALYYYPKEVVPLVKKYLDEGGSPDQPGRFVEWLYKKKPVYTWRFKKWYDIGTKETLAAAEEYFSSRGRE